MRYAGLDRREALSIVKATVGWVDKALTLLESNRVPSTKTAPVQWNQMGQTREVASRPVEASRVC